MQQRILTTGTRDELVAWLEWDDFDNELGDLSGWTESELSEAMCIRLEVSGR